MPRLPVACRLSPGRLVSLLQTPYRAASTRTDIEIRVLAVLAVQAVPETKTLAPGGGQKGQKGDQREVLAGTCPSKTENTPLPLP